MSWEVAFLIYGVLLFALLAFGAAIGAVMGFVGIVGVTALAGVSLWPTFGDVVWNTTNSFTLIAVPLFVLMGEIIVRSGVSPRFYRGLTRLVGRMKGGLAQSNIVGCAIFAAISGSSTATALTIGVVALPEMRKRGYSDDLTLGTLTGGGCLGILIPPSIPLVIYATVVQESLVDLFMAGIVPGILLAVIFMIYVRLLVTLRPGLAPAQAADPGLGLGEALVNCIPITVLIAAVIGGMYFGIVTPTEAGALGCAIALLLSLLHRELTWAALREALGSTVITTAVVIFIMMNSQVLSYALTVSGIGSALSQGLRGMQLDPFLFFCCLVVLYTILGMFIDGISMMLLTVPVLFPAILAAGFDLVWFGIIMVVLIELGQLTPPMGLNLFAVQSIAGDVPLGRIARSSLPYAVLITAFCFLLYAFPEIALWLPRSMKE
jgi:tripartite ATP-independent transporter DctM subunit